MHSRLAFLSLLALLGLLVGPAGCTADEPARPDDPGPVAEEEDGADGSANGGPSVLRVGDREVAVGETVRIDLPEGHEHGDDRIAPLEARVEAIGEASVTLDEVVHVVRGGRDRRSAADEPVVVAEETTLTGRPLAADMNATWVLGVEREDDGLRLTVDARMRATRPPVPSGD